MRVCSYLQPIAGKSQENQVLPNTSLSNAGFWQSLLKLPASLLEAAMLAAGMQIASVSSLLQGTAHIPTNQTLLCSHVTQALALQHVQDGVPIAMR